VASCAPKYPVNTVIVMTTRTPRAMLSTVNTGRSNAG
jgi:hypothetical protein